MVPDTASTLNDASLTQPMPALPSGRGRTVNDELEEPYNLGRHDGRSFSPRTTMARNSGQGSTANDELDEPYNLGQQNGRSFSPRTTMARNSSIHTPVITARNSGATIVSGLTGTTAQTSRELMLRIYTEKSSSHLLTNHDKMNIAEAAKNFVVGRIKFILPDRKFQSFWQPDLLTNTPSYVDAFFDMYGNKYRERKVNDNVLAPALELWKAAAPKIKKIVDNHRSGVAQKMKSDILTGLTYLATRRGDSTEDEEFFSKNSTYNKEILDGLETIFQQYVVSNDNKKLARLRIEDVNAFHAFTVLCLRHTVGVMAWRLKHRKFLISEIFSLSDEALALVILENNAKVWKDKAYGTVNESTKARYMKQSQDGSVRKDWSDEGKMRFNDIFSQVRELCPFSLSRTNETTLRSLWNEASRNQRRRRDHSQQRSDSEAGVVQGGARLTFMCEG